MNRSCIDNGNALLTIYNLTIGAHFQAAFCLKTGWHPLLFYTFHDGSQLMTIDVAGSLQRTVEADVEGESPFLVGLYSDNDGIVGL